MKLMDRKDNSYFSIIELIHSILNIHSEACVDSSACNRCQISYDIVRDTADVDNIIKNALTTCSTSFMIYIIAKHYKISQSTLLIDFHNYKCENISTCNKCVDDLGTTLSDINCNLCNDARTIREIVHKAGNNELCDIIKIIKILKYKYGKELYREGEIDQYD